MRLFIAGDTHGNERWVKDYLYPVAGSLGANAIVQLGDFGFWEHDRSGVDFLDALAFCADEYGIPLYWLHGNHDKHSLALEKYGTNRTHDGFMWCRAGVNYIPQGFAWTWAGVRFRSFGGAYSVDKEYRLDAEQNRDRKAWVKEMHRRDAGEPPRTPPSSAGTLWFPEEEMTDLEMDELLAADSGPKDVIFSHDMPRGSNPGWNRKDFPECWPNQDRLQRALLAHQPELWFHGHLHYKYEAMVRCGDDDRFTRVIGLNADDNAATAPWKATDSWCLLDIADGKTTVISGAEAEELLL